MAHEQKRPEPSSLVLHSSFIILNKYVIKKGLKAGLLDQDRFLVTLACLFTSGKVHSHFMRSRDLLEYYFFNRPLDTLKFGSE